MCKPSHTLQTQEELYGSQRLVFWNAQHEVWKASDQNSPAGFPEPRFCRKKERLHHLSRNISVPFVKNFSCFWAKTRPPKQTNKQSRKHFSGFWALVLKLILPSNYWRPWWEWVVNWTFTFLPIMLLYCPDCGEAWEVGFVYYVELEVDRALGKTNSHRTGTWQIGAIPEGCQSPFWL